MKKIGIVLWAHPHYGGVFQYSLSILHAAAALTHDCYSITVFYRHSAWRKYMEEPQCAGFDWVRYHANIPLSILGMACRIAERNGLLLKLYRQLHPIWHTAKALGIELMIYPAPITLSFEINIPYIIAVHDLQHRLHPEFPEVSAHGEWGRREYLFSNCCRHAVMVLTESEEGKKDVRRFYGQHSDNIRVLPYIPAHYLNAVDMAEVVNKYSLPSRYLFYPAQFWEHKNHVRLIEALHLLKKEQGLEIPIIFVGAKKNAYRKTMKRVAELGMSGQAIYLGYVSDEDMIGFYRTAAALVMPTFFGPSNIPQLEAFLLGCPVITSDVPGIHEQVGDAALLIAPESVRSIAEGIERVWCDDTFRQELVRKGYERVAAWTPERFGARFRAICEEAAAGNPSRE